MTKPKTKLISKAERLKGLGKAALTSATQDDALRQDESVLQRALDLCDAKVRSLAELPIEELDPNSLYKLANSITGLSRARGESRKTQLELGGAVILAEERIKAELRKLLSGEPELVAKIHELAGRARENIEAQPLVIEG